MIVVGLLSGTSVDAIDVAAARFTSPSTPDGELDMQLLGHHEASWPPGLRARILALAPPAATSIGEVCRLDTEIGQAFAAVAADAVRDLTNGEATLVASLGQTVFHDVRDGRCHGTLQLGQPAWITEATGLPVVSDLRAADVAAGGHGAPLASTFDALWLAPGSAALNLGGIANATVLGGDGSVLAFDTGPANCLLDLAAERLTGEPCDRGGALAARGTVDEAALAALRADAYFAAPPPKSCGRELFDDAYLRRAGALDGPDLMATLVELTASTVADALCSASGPGLRGPREVVVSGGGTRNPVLLAALRRRLPTARWRTSDELGLPADAKEAYVVALLGWLAWHGLPGVAPSDRATPSGDAVTGARHGAVLGRVTRVHRRAGSRPSGLRIVPG